VAQSKPRVVLVVDDERIICQTLAAILRQAGFAASAFDNAQSAIESAEFAPPDLLITDVIMPGMSGIELAILFRGKWQECKILLFSGQAITADLLEEARQSGHQFDILAKPIHPTELLAKLNELG
jgi:CheY-like chemotaxis protein